MTGNASEMSRNRKDRRYGSERERKINPGVGGINEGHAGGKAGIVGYISKKPKHNSIKGKAIDRKEKNWGVGCRLLPHKNTTSKTKKTCKSKDVALKKLSSLSDHILSINTT